MDLDGFILRSAVSSIVTITTPAAKEFSKSQPCGEAGSSVYQAVPTIGWTQSAAAVPKPTTGSLEGVIEGFEACGSTVD
jgi:hypothetical protein